MTTVNDAVETGARALADEWSAGERLAVHSDDAFVAARAMWPILSAGLRELHRRYTVYDWDGACPNKGEAHTEAHHHEDNVGDWYCDQLPLRLACDTCRDLYGTAEDWPCATVRELDRIDKELGL